MQTNYYGMWVLYQKEVMRFIKVYNQTLITPAISALLLLAVFSLAIDGHVEIVPGVSFRQFIAPGLIMMSVLQNAFANSSSSLIMGKILGSIIDLLLPPLSAMEITLAYTLAAITRAILCGILVACAISFLIPLEIKHVGYALFYLFSAAGILALLGMLAGIFADSFDQMSAITSYIITPLSFLSGTFYSVNRLPEPWHFISHLNPFFYMIDGFRYSMTGFHDADLGTGVAILLFTHLVLFVATLGLLQKGSYIKN